MHTSSSVYDIPFRSIFGLSNGIAAAAAAFTAPFPTLTQKKKSRVNDYKKKERNLNPMIADFLYDYQCRSEDGVEVNKRRWWLKGSDGGKRKGK
jgi:hypothetical protein